MRRASYWAFVLCWVVLLVGLWAGVFAQEEASAAGKLQEPLGPWATTAFVGLVLFLAMAFVVAIGWLSRSRRY